MEIVVLVCDIDDFCQIFELLWRQHLVSAGSRLCWREQRLCLSEVMTIVVSFPHSGYRTFKDYYLRYVAPYLRWAFQPKKPSLHIRMPQDALLPLVVL